MAQALLVSPTTAPRAADDGDADRTLIARVRAGDDAAFAVLYRRYQRRIAAHIYGMVKDYGRAEDLTQDVFMSALRRMRETDREIVFKPWIYEIAKNACIDQYRRSRRTEEVSYDAEDTLAAADHRRLVSAGPSPDDAVDQKIALDDLRSAFGGLSQTHHDILVMREFEGLSYREIGDRLGMTRPSVESTLFRARRRLAEEYEELVSGARCVRVQQIIAAAATASLGTRDRRRLAAHVSHCQGCRRHALRAGIDPALLRPKVGAKVAALLPLPAFLRRRLEDAESTAAVSVSQGSAHAAQWSAQLSSFADPSLFAGWARAAAAAATIAAAGIGAGVANELTKDSGSAHVSPGGSSYVVPAGAAAVKQRAARSATAVRTRATAPRAVETAGSGGAVQAAGGSRAGGGPVSTASPPGSSAPVAPPNANLGVGKLLPKAPAGPAVADPVVEQRRPLRDAVRGLVRDTRRAAAPVVRDTRAFVEETVAETTARVDGIFHGG